MFKSNQELTTTAAVEAAISEASSLSDLKEIIKKEIKGLSDLRWTIISKLSTPEADYINGFILAYLLWAAVPVGLVKREGLEHKQNELAERYNLKSWDLEGE